MKPLLLVRLWLMVFLHYFVWGAWYVTMGNYATTKLGFAGGQVGLAYGTLAIGALLSPLIVGVIADHLRTLAHRADLATTLDALGVVRDRLPHLADEAIGQWTAKFNPRSVTRADLLQIYETAFA